MGLPVPGPLLDLAQNGCRSGDLDTREGWAIIPARHGLAITLWPRPARRSVRDQHRPRPRLRERTARDPGSPSRRRRPEPAKAKRRALGFDARYCPKLGLKRTTWPRQRPRQPPSRACRAAGPSACRECADRGRQFLAVCDDVHHAALAQDAERWKPSGSFSRIVASMTRGPVKASCAPGSAMCTSPASHTTPERRPKSGQPARRCGEAWLVSRPGSPARCAASASAQTRTPACVRRLKR